MTDTPVVLQISCHPFILFDLLKVLAPLLRKRSCRMSAPHHSEWWTLAWATITAPARSATRMSCPWRRMERSSTIWSVSSRSPATWTHLREALMPSCRWQCARWLCFDLITKEFCIFLKFGKETSRVIYILFCGFRKSLAGEMWLDS